MTCHKHVMNSVILTFHGQTEENINFSHFSCWYLIKLIGNSQVAFK